MKINRVSDGDRGVRRTGGGAMGTRATRHPARRDGRTGTRLNSHTTQYGTTPQPAPAQPQGPHTHTRHSTRRAALRALWHISRWVPTQRVSYKGGRALTTVPHSEPLRAAAVPHQHVSPHLASQHLKSSRNMFILRHSSTADVVSRPRPRQMASATTPKRWRNL